MKRCTLLFLCFAFYVGLSAQYKKWYSISENTLQFELNGFIKKIHFIDNTIVNVSVQKVSHIRPFNSLIAINRKLLKINLQTKESDSSLNVYAGSLHLIINKLNGTVAFGGSGSVSYIKEAAFTDTSFQSIMDDGKQAYSTQQRFKLAPGEGLYGLGEYQDGKINRRGKKIVMVQSNQQDVIPFIVSTNNYGILWDNYSKTIFDDNENGMSFWSEIGDEINYYFIAGKNIDSVITGYRRITGTVPMFGKAVFGYWQSRERYTSAEQLLSIASEYRKRRIPIDYIVQDWNYWGGNQYWSGMRWDRKFFPNPDSLIHELHDKYHLKFMISIWPCVGPESAVYKELDEHGLLFKGNSFFLAKQARIYDAFSNKGRDIYFKYVRDSLLDKGVDALWMDGTEPEFDDSQNPIVSERGIKKGGISEIGSLARYLNAYSLMTTKGAYEKQRELNNGKRVFTLTRSSFAGQQKYGAVTWSGDNGSNWRTLKNQVANGIDFSMAGVPYWTHDIGGFFPGYLEGQYPAGVNSLAWRELYIRWFQFGAFTPIFRSHGTGTRREVWNFGNPGDEMYEALIDFMHLRYRLLPYIYTTSWQVSNKGFSFIRGMMMDAPKDKKTYDIDDQYIFGNSFLVKPVTHEMYNPRNYVLDKMPLNFLTTNEGQQGLQVAYFKGTKFEELITNTIDTVFDFTFPNAGLETMGITGKTKFSVRWNGFITVPETGDYVLGANSDDGVRIWINDKLVVNDWYDKEANTSFFKLKLIGNNKNTIKIEYYQNNGGASFKLGYLTPDMLNVLQKNRNDSVSTYLPKVGSIWFDFWTGKKYNAGTHLSQKYPLNKMPLFVKAGTILPLADTMQYSTEKRNDTLEIRIYPGADGSFELYEDENDSYNYEKGIYSIIQFNWNNKNRILTINPRKGTYPGMPAQRIFKVILVGEQKGVGIYESKHFDQVILYAGDIKNVKL